MTYSLHPGAEHDLDDACRWYKHAASGRLIGRFLNEFERVARLLVQQPGLGTPTDDGRSAFALRGFPNTLIYKSTEQGVRVLVVRHQHRDPTHGESRR